MEKVIAKSKAESERLTTIRDDKEKKQRDINFQSEMEKIQRNRELKRDKVVFKNDDEFKEAGLEILKNYSATEAEKQWFLGLVKARY